MTNKTKKTALAGRVPKKKRPAKKRPAKRQAFATSTPLPPVQWKALGAGEPDVVDNILTDDINAGTLGLEELKLTDAEEAVLAEGVDVSLVRVKPTANGAVYLSHTAYTRWLNRAFGRLAWMLSPRSKAKLAGKSVIQPYILYIHGRPVIFAYGDQDYFEGNRDQSYGDALESTYASALRRCCKHMGVSLELWDRDWTDTFLREQCVRVGCKPKKEGESTEYKWRRKSDAPFWNELERGPRSTSAPVRTAAPPSPGTNPNAGNPITRPQRQRLATIVKNAGRAPTEVAMWLKARFGIDSSEFLQIAFYDFVCKAIAAPGPLPLENQE